jgi:hypothetical protein
VPISLAKNNINSVSTFNEIFEGNILSSQHQSKVQKQITSLDHILELHEAAVPWQMFYFQTPLRCNEMDM